MGIGHVGFALLLALFFAAVLVFVLLRRGPGRAEAFALFAILIFLVLLAGAAWLVPLGPTLWGVPWAALLLLGLVVTLLIALVAHPLTYPVVTDEDDLEPPAPAGWGCGVLFWVVLLLLVAVILFRYVWSGSFEAAQRGLSPFGQPSSMERSDIRAD